MIVRTILEEMIMYVRIVWQEGKREESKRKKKWKIGKGTRGTGERKRGKKKKKSRERRKMDEIERLFPIWRRPGVNPTRSCSCRKWIGAGFYRRRLRGLQGGCVLGALLHRTTCRGNRLRVFSSKERVERLKGINRC